MTVKRRADSRTARPRGTLRGTRLVLAALGGGLMAHGGWLLLERTREDTVPQLVVWLAGAVVLHDGLLVPLVLLCGWALHTLAPPWAWGVLRGGLVVAGLWTLLALPVLARPGRPANPSVLPLDYLHNWAWGLVAVAAVTGALLLARWLRHRGASGRRRGVTPSSACGTAADPPQGSP